MRKEGMHIQLQIYVATRKLLNVTRHSDLIAINSQTGHYWLSEGCQFSLLQWQLLSLRDLSCLLS
jgi:hypothetical protein